MNFRATEVFAIAKKYNLFSAYVNPHEISNEDFLNFCTEYKEHTNIRDRNLIAHLQSSPVLFRTFIPYNQNLPQTLSQVVWYYDEIIIPDPLGVIISKKERNNIEFQEDKEYVYGVIQFLKRFHDSIEEGFALLCIDKAFPEFDETIKENKQYLDLIKDQEVLRELESLIDIGIQKLDGKNINGIVASHRGLRTLKFVPTINKNEAYISFIDKYERGTVKDLERLGIRNMIEGEMRKSFVYDIGEIVSNFVIAENFNSHAMYSRKVDEVVLRKLNKTINNYKSDYNDTAFKVTLPFVDGIPTETLVELRMKMPNIFEEFRHHMAELIIKIQKEEGGNPEMVDYKVRSEINKQLTQFEKEQKIALKKARIIGLGTPILSLAGTLAIHTFGIDLNTLLQILGGGAISYTELNTLNNYLKDKEEAKANSLYYLWRIKKK